MTVFHTNSWRGEGYSPYWAIQGGTAQGVAFLSSQYTKMGRASLKGSENCHFSIRKDHKINVKGV